jgi:hypothetical protein
MHALHALQVENQLGRLRISMLKGEFQKLGYVMGGPAELRRSAHDLQKSVWPDLAELKRRAADIPRQQSPAPQLTIAL